MTAPADLDFDALERDVTDSIRDGSSLAYIDPDTALALLALARRTVEAEALRARIAAAMGWETAGYDDDDLVAAVEHREEARKERDAMLDDATLRDRIATIASEAFGPFPVQTVEEDLTAIERGIHEAGKYGEEWRARAEQRERDAAVARAEATEAMTKLDDLRTLPGELLKALHLADKTSDGHRDAHAAFQRWAAVHAPDAIGDEAKREAIDRKLAQAGAVVHALTTGDERALVAAAEETETRLIKERDTARVALAEACSALRAHDDADRIREPMARLEAWEHIAAGMSARPPLDPECPGPNCAMCNGAACDLCGAGCWSNSVPHCDHATDERHRDHRPAVGTGSVEILPVDPVANRIAEAYMSRTTPPAVPRRIASRPPQNQALLDVLRATIDLRRAESEPVPGDSITEIEANAPAVQRVTMVALTKWRSVVDEHMPALTAVLGGTP